VSAKNTELRDELLKHVGQEFGPYKGWDKVNSAMIRHWCEAMGDTNPLYLDEDFAASTPHRGLVAPPTMLQAWNMTGYAGQSAPDSSQEDAFFVATLLDKAGYPGVVAVNCEQEYFKYLREGDEIHHTARVEAVSEEKTTALGVGFFLTQLSEYWNQDDEKVAEMRFRIFKYKPAQSQAATAETGDGMPPGVPRQRPLRSRDNAFFWEGVDKGKLPIQRCKSCETLRHPPGPMCMQCNSLEWDTVTASGRGTLYSYVVMHHPAIPPFNYPNLIGLVELEEGTRLVTQIVGTKSADVKIGMAVELSIEEVEEGLNLPLFKIAAGG